MTDRILGWRLDRADRADLLRRFPPRYAQIVADHVTFGRAANAPPLLDHETARIVGHADDGEGVEALVVALGGSIDRPTGGTYHITWSLAEGREAIESNHVIARCGWREIADGPLARLEPSHWP